MWWMTLGKIIGAIITLYLIYALIKELRSVVKRSNDGECSGKCDLD